MVCLTSMDASWGTRDDNHGKTYKDNGSLRSGHRGLFVPEIVLLPRSHDELKAYFNMS